MASFRGTNMQAIIDACNDGRLTARPAVVISNNGDSMALERAEAEGIPAFHLSSKSFPDADELDRLITDTLLNHNVDLVVLAGYMKKIGPCLLQTYNGRIINVHPALLPLFGGKGMYGIHVHEAVIAAGATETGASIHVVTEDYDAGPILARQKVPVLEGDTPDKLAERVLAVEHELYVTTIGRIVSGEIRLNGLVI